MNDRIQITPAVLRAVADVHDEVAEQITTAQSAGAEIRAAVASYGPIMHQVKAATADLLNQRDATLGEHAATHRSAADLLRRAAANFTSADELNAERLRLTDEHAVPLSDQSFTAATPDGSVFVRVAVRGHVLGVQLEPEAMGRPGHEIAERIMACADVAYLQAQVAVRCQWEQAGIATEDFAGIPTEADLVAARERLGKL